MQKLKLHSADQTARNLSQLQTLLPHCFSEGKIDFDLLKQELSDHLIEGNQERYQLNWVGKREAILAANAPIAKTLRPVRDESVNFDTTENLFIEGDNLDALKLLQETYLGKVKMIYIDPPYNTGNDFVYKDNFAETQSDFLTRSNQIDEQGNRLVSNPESNGRFHSDWLSMIYPRLKLARNLLADDGVIFISIDDNEQANLKRVCDEIFGEQNLIAQCIHKNNSNKNQSKFIGVSTEYIFIYSKSLEFLSNSIEFWRIKKEGTKDIALKFKQLREQGLSLDEILSEIKDMYKRPKYAHLSRWNKIDEFGIFKDADLSRQGGRKDYTIINPYTGKECLIPARGWGKSYEELLRLQRENLIWYGDDNSPPSMKSYISEDDYSVADNFWYFDNSVDTRFIKDTFGGLLFENPKPLEMLKRIVEIISDKNALILDFFAGSATTAHAVMQLNAEDGGNRKFIMVQLPEKTDPKSEAHKAGFATIAEISKERIRRAGKQIAEQGSGGDVGFRVLKIDSSNLNDVYYSPSALTQKDLYETENLIKADRSAEDLLFQTLLDLGIALSSPIERISVQNKTVFKVAENQLIACFEEIDEPLISELAQFHPQQAVFLDTKFTNDSVKINAVQIFKQISPKTGLNVI